jgi:hypothetical protein
MRKTLTISSLFIVLVLISSSFVSAGIFDWLSGGSTGKAYEAPVATNVPECPQLAPLICAEGQRIVSKNFGYDVNNCPISAATCCGNGACESPVEDITQCPEDCASTEIKESVKCVFENSDNAEKCYSDDQRFSCSGIGTCVMDVSGKQGSQLIWKSSCGGYAYTTIDGQNEYATFKCVTNNPSCTDSDGGKNFYTRGYVKADNAVYDDKCAFGQQGNPDTINDKNMLFEAYCFEDGSGYGYDTYSCPNGCQDGVCIHGAKCEIDSDCPQSTCTCKVGETCACPATQPRCVNGVCEGFKCESICKNIGTKSEGWYDSCTGELIKYDLCGAQPGCATTNVCEDGTVPECFFDSGVCICEACPAQPVCEPIICSDGSKTSCTLTDGDCACSTCPAQPVCESQKCEDGSTTKCAMNMQTGQCVCSACPPVSKTCDNGCSSNGKCIPFGTRLEQEGQGMFCDIMGQKFLQQKAENEACQNNFECITNSCSSGKCIDIAKKLEEQQSLLQKILDWLRRLF